MFFARIGWDVFAILEVFSENYENDNDVPIKSLFFTPIGWDALAIFVVFSKIDENSNDTPI